MRAPRWSPRLPWALLGLTVLVAAVDIVLAWRYEPDAGSLGDRVVLVLEWSTVLGFAVVGAVVTVRSPANPVGWLCAGLSVVFWSSSSAALLPEAGLVDAWPLGMVERLAFPVGLCVAVFLFLLFPAGTVPGRRWRWLGRVAAGCLALTVATGLLLRRDSDSTVEVPWALAGGAADLALAVFDSALFALVVSWLAALASMVPRFVRAAPVEREQLKWVFLAVLLNLGQLVVRPLVPDGVGEVYSALVLAALPVSIGVAVTRYRLFEIDRIVSRTVSYTVLTTGLLVAYLAVVAVLRGVLAPLTGTTDLAVAASTLAVAAAFRPARRRVQGLVDRRFDRARYDAARTVEDYARRLRTEVDLQEVTAGLRDTVTATVGPERVVVWLRSGPPPGELPR